MKKIAPFVVFVILLSACAGGLPFAKPTPTLDPCRAELITPYLEAADQIAGRFDDETKLANSTMRGSLAPLIQSMQEIRRDTQALDVPSCAEWTNETLIAYMDATIDGFIAFMADRPDSEVNKKFDEADLHLSEHSAAFGALIQRSTP